MPISTNRRARVLAIAVFLFLVPAGLRPQAQVPSAQGGPDASAKFEVASIKRNPGTEPFVQIGMRPGGRYVATNVALRQLITSAYRIQGFQLVGGPDWIRTDRFDINAKAEGDIPPSPPGGIGAMQIMLRNLLAERFKLVAHEEEREMPMYALVLARDDKRLGPALHPSSFDCDARPSPARGGAPPPAPSPSDRPLCGMRTGNGSMVAGAFAIGALPGILAPIVQRYVVDRTGLAGNFDFDLTYTPDQVATAGGAAGDAPRADASGPSIYTALQEQLGLKLESVRGPVKVLVIDSVQRLTED